MKIPFLLFLSNIIGPAFPADSIRSSRAIHRPDHIRRWAFRTLSAPENSGTHTCGAQRRCSDRSTSRQPTIDSRYEEAGSALQGEKFLFSVLHQVLPTILPR